MPIGMMREKLIRLEAGIAIQRSAEWIVIGMPLRRKASIVLGQALTLLSESGPNFVRRALSEESWHSQDF